MQNIQGQSKYFSKINLYRLVTFSTSFLQMMPQKSKDLETIILELQRSFPYIEAIPLKSCYQSPKQSLTMLQFSQLHQFTVKNANGIIHSSYKYKNVCSAVIVLKHFHINYLVLIKHIYRTGKKILGIGNLQFSNDLPSLQFSSSSSSSRVDISRLITPNAFLRKSSFDILLITSHCMEFWDA